eukprot:2383747-Pleurochrysis_carterae.AAC.1
MHGSALPVTPDSERSISKTTRILRAERAEDGAEGLGGQIAGLEFELETKRRICKRPHGQL